MRTQAWGDEPPAVELVEDVDAGQVFGIDLDRPFVAAIAQRRQAQRVNLGGVVAKTEILDAGAPDLARHNETDQRDELFGLGLCRLLWYTSTTHSLNNFLACSSVMRAWYSAR